MTEQLVRVYVHTCKCGHTNYFIIGGGQDIICKKCLNYTLKYEEKKAVTIDEWKKANYPK